MLFPGNRVEANTIVHAGFIRGSRTGSISRLSAFGGTTSTTTVR